MNWAIFVRYNHEISLVNYAKPNQEIDFVRYNCEFVITVIVITEFDCILFFRPTTLAAVVDTEQKWDAQLEIEAI